MEFLVQLLRNRLVSTARESIGKNASLGQLYGKMQEAYHQMQTPLVYQDPSARVSTVLDQMNKLSKLLDVHYV